MSRDFSLFTHRGASYRIYCLLRGATAPTVITREIVRQRSLLEAYIDRYPVFRDSLAPIPQDPAPPQIAIEMHRASEMTGVGPMAAVAGAMAEYAVRAGIAAGATEAIVDNGGDIFIVCRSEITVGIWPGKNIASAWQGGVAFRIPGPDTPMAVCSSSGTMGHSFSMGSCDLATVIAENGALADAGATLAANMVSHPEDIPAALERVAAINGIKGLFIVSKGKIGLIGDLPQIVPYAGDPFGGKIIDLS